MQTQINFAPPTPNPAKREIVSVEDGGTEKVVAVSPSPGATSHKLSYADGAKVTWWVRDTDSAGKVTNGPKSVIPAE